MPVMAVAFIVAAAANAAETFGFAANWTGLGLRNYVFEIRFYSILDFLLSVCELTW